MYAEVRKGEVDPTVAGRLCQILAILLASTKTFQFEERLDALEAQLKAQKPNGRAGGEAHIRGVHEHDQGLHQ